MKPQDVANNGAAYLQAFFSSWSVYVELEKQRRDLEIIDLISSMIRSTESNLLFEKADEQRLGKLAVVIACRLPAMRRAFIEIVGR